MKRSLASLFAASCLVIACSDDAPDKGGGAAGSKSGTDEGRLGYCIGVCVGLQVGCGSDSDDCGVFCKPITSAQSDCLAAAKCDEPKLETCVPGAASLGKRAPGKGGAGGAGGTAAASCSLFKCTKTSECAFQPCMSTQTGTSYCYGQAAKESECAGIGAPKGAVVSGSQRILCVPDGCPDPSAQLP